MLFCVFFWGGEGEEMGGGGQVRGMDRSERERKKRVRERDGDRGRGRREGGKVR